MLKQLILQRKLQQRKEELGKLLEQEEALKIRGAELETAIGEAGTEEEMGVVEEGIAALEAEEKELQEKKSGLENEIKEIEGELDALNSKDPKDGAGKPAGAGGEEKKEDNAIMTTRAKFFTGLTREARDAFLGREDTKQILQEVRAMGKQQRAVVGAELTFPDTMLGMLRDNLHRYSKLITKVNLKAVAGKARQNIAGTIPEAVWTEMVANLNELSFVFNQIEVDGYKVGGYVAMPNSTLEDSDLNLANELLDGISQAMGLALDKAILYGTGVKMPVGIVTRLAQTAQPSNWGQNAPPWKDLSADNVKAIDIASYTKAEQFFAALMLLLGIPRPNYATGGTFWAMNRYTRMQLMSKSIAFNSAAAIVAGMNGTMPVEGGDIVELDFLSTGDIVGGYGSLYLLAERAGAQLAQSEHVRFIQDQTVFRGTARYDGMPIFGEAFLALNINNTAPVLTKTFPADTANP